MKLRDAAFWGCCAGAGLDAIMVLVCQRPPFPHELAELFLVCAVCFVVGAAALFFDGGE